MVVGILVNVGMWFERFVIVTTLERGHLPATWDYFEPTWVDIGMFIGSFGLFMTLFLLFCRYLPTVAISEAKGTMEYYKNFPSGTPTSETGPEGASQPASAH